MHLEYKRQKQKVQLMVKEAITISERKITHEIRTSKNKSKTLWENIDKLRKKERASGDETQLYDENKKPLDKDKEKEQLINYWTSIYQQHRNEIGLEWGPEKQRSYRQELESTQNRDFPASIAEHMDMAFYIEPKIEPMEKPEVTDGEVQLYVKSMKNQTAPGPDGLKNELYKSLAQTKVGLNTLTVCMRSELNDCEKPSTWNTSITKMIPKVAKPTAKQLRPIALTDSSYKLFMHMIREKTEEHLKTNKELMEIQAGFTSGGRVEDNLFLLNYCVAETFAKKKTLFVTAIDYAKAFDSVKRSRLIEVMKKYKIHPDIINSVTAVYTEDNTRIKLNEDTDEVIKITSGIRQGCTGSTTLFKLLTYEIAKNLIETRMGYRDRQIYLPILLFADDGLMLSQSAKETEDMLKVLIKASGQCGLKINKEKSVIIVYNQKEDSDEMQEIEGIPVKEETKYLGVKITDKKDLFKEQRKQALEKAQRMANMTFGVINKSCNKLLIGKTFWKNLALPSILYGMNVITLSETEIKNYR